MVVNRVLGHGGDTKKTKYMEKHTVLRFLDRALDPIIMSIHVPGIIAFGCQSSQQTVAKSKNWTMSACQTYISKIQIECMGNVYYICIKHMCMYTHIILYRCVAQCIYCTGLCTMWCCYTILHQAMHD